MSYTFRFLLKGVRLGEWNLSTNPDCDENNCADPYIDVPVAERIPHEGFSKRENDIALLRLARSVTFSNWIKPICLPVSPGTYNTNYVDYHFTVAGWGRVSFKP